MLQTTQCSLSFSPHKCPLFSLTLIYIVNDNVSHSVSFSVSHVCERPPWHFSSGCRSKQATNIFALHWKLNVLVLGRFVCVHFIRLLYRCVFCFSSLYFQLVPFCHCHYLAESSANKKSSIDAIVFVEVDAAVAAVVIVKMDTSTSPYRMESYLTLNFMRHWIIEKLTHVHFYCCLTLQLTGPRVGEGKRQVLHEIAARRTC